MVEPKIKSRLNHLVCMKEKQPNHKIINEAKTKKKKKVKGLGAPNSGVLSQ